MANRKLLKREFHRYVADKVDPQIQVIDNFFETEKYEELVGKVSSLPFLFGWGSSKEDPHGHWNYNFVKEGGGSSNLSDVTPRLPEYMANLWDLMKQTNSFLEDKIPTRCYLNAHTYGVDGYTHTDSRKPGDWTVIIYIVQGDEDWKADWAGETILVHNDDVVKSVLPKKNRVLFFPGNMYHAARTVSRMCGSLRRTLMYKCRSRYSDNFEKLSQFLIEKEAYKINHGSGGSLHDHLLRTFQYLEHKKVDPEVCFAAGLHSIFGTNAFRKQLLDYDSSSEIGEVFGKKAETLALIFARALRPSTLENPIENGDGTYTIHLQDEQKISISEETLYELRMMECSNLEDQRGIDDVRFPNLTKLWFKD